MDKETKRNIQLGLFVTVGILLFVALIFLVGTRNGMFTKSFKISTYFSNASGLKNGANVRLNGVKVGVVSSVRFITGDKIQVDMSIEKSKENLITKDAVASISSDGLMGDKLVDISIAQPGGKLVDDGDFIRSTEPMDMGKIMDKLASTGDDINAISHGLRKVADSLSSGHGSLQMLYSDTSMAHDLKLTMTNLRRTSEAVEGAGRAVQGMVADVKSGRGDLGKLIKDTGITSNLSASMVSLRHATDKFNTISQQLDVTAKRLNSGPGTVNMLVNDSAFARDVRQSVVNIKKASDNLNQDLEAVKHNFLLKGYFKKQEKNSKKK